MKTWFTLPLPALAALMLVMLLMPRDIAQAQSPAGGIPAPPGKINAVDEEGDKGEAIQVYWSLSPNDPSASAMPDLNTDSKSQVKDYLIYRRLADGSDDFVKVGSQTYGVNSYTDSNVKEGVSYLYGVAAMSPGGNVSAMTTMDYPVAAVMQWFDYEKAWMGIMLLIISGCIITYIRIARSGRVLKVREIAGLSAVDEAVGRATEMGRPILFINGILDINDIQTLAGLTVLSRVAKTAAEYGATLEVPTARALVMTTARETVQEAYLSAGRPDAYQEDRIYYLTDEQFGYVAGVTGFMVREKPAACIYMGAFYAESLILAETGNHIGAIQVAGTAMPSQLPFFVAACDYTLIGEEFFAASAYLSGDPQQLGSLKGQDLGKLLGGGLLIVGVVFATLELIWPGSAGVTNVREYISDNILGSSGLTMTALEKGSDEWFEQILQNQQDYELKTNALESGGIDA